MDIDLDMLLSDLRDAAPLTADEQIRFSERLALLGGLTPQEHGLLLAAVSGLELRSDGAIQQRLEALLAAVARPYCRRVAAETQEAPPELVAMAAELYRNLGPNCAGRHHLLALIAGGAGVQQLPQLAELLIDDPPTSDDGAALALAPLLGRGPTASVVFPRLLDALGDRRLAAAILDVANFLTRAGHVPEHPAAERRALLLRLLAGLVEGLEMLEEDPRGSASSAEQLQTRVSEAIALSAGLCDALALLDEREAIPRLYRALEIGHRRVQAEAAAALARMGEESGREALKRLAAAPVVRLRALAYAEELDLLEQIDAEHRSALAEAEGEVAAWLAEPHHIGIPPGSLELLDHRTLYWPGFEQPMDCWLFQFGYSFPQGSWTGWAIAGPATYALRADLSHLSYQQIFAAFAGWQALHEDIYERSVGELLESQRPEVARLERRLHDAGFEAIEPYLLAYFFGERLLIAAVQWEGIDGAAIAGDDEPRFIAGGNPDRPITPELAYQIEKGLRLLKAFNPEEDWDATG